ncbi:MULTISPECIES: SDR family NAD(P)-dependent oxidoreductase [Legionella]|uniref:Oxidoreductase with NAD(P)-binding Rossmann-fold domain protein n=1 Tax=Legionella maceachernii TaxID=466 RepID=A0A0W0W6P4_9GAMM|nr:SDR family NAD(P)-dependent oxidoreductase [Legionella maceachernii]KTD28043.1 oxidoreductase with NAD(P)-binding Rossmann-fold domain protein [Legionella maceachernii]SKA07460.1 Short-chain dehydrogenase [Legionella maceachernii]SUO99817.1 3-oxoacyl-[acyl-carrier-protein] reductase FabG [Legionella maceachernii]
MQQKTILITGCSTGIGHDAALSLSRRGHRVIATCRKEADVKKLIDLGLETIQMDMDDEQSIASAFTDVLAKTSGHLDVLINNAGYGQAGALEDISRQTLRDQFETNVFGLMDLTRLAIPVMRKQGQGRIINISSILGIISMPFRGAYNASKHAVEGLSDTLRLELRSSGIEVICIEPGPIASRFRDNAVDHSLKKIDKENSFFKQQYQKMLNGYREQKEESLFTRGTDAVIAKLVHAIEAQKPKTKYPVTFPAHLFVVLKRILSVRMLDRFIAYLSKKELGST